MLACVFYHPLINPIVNPAAEILPVNEITKIVMVNEAALCCSR